MSLLAHETWAGNGPPLLLLHGFTGNRSTFAHLRERLTPHASVVAVDLPGHGQSPISAETTNWFTICKRRICDWISQRRARRLGT